MIIDPDRLTIVGNWAAGIHYLVGPGPCQLEFTIRVQASIGKIIGQSIRTTTQLILTILGLEPTEVY